MAAQLSWSDIPQRVIPSPHFKRFFSVTIRAAKVLPPRLPTIGQGSTCQPSLALIVTITPSSVSSHTCSISRVLNNPSLYRFSFDFSIAASLIRSPSVKVSSFRITLSRTRFPLISIFRIIPPSVGFVSAPAGKAANSKTRINNTDCLIIGPSFGLRLQVIALQRHYYFVN